MRLLGSPLFGAFGLGLLLALGASACGLSSPTPETTAPTLTPLPSAEPGFVEGAVRFIGVPCPPEEASGRKPQVPPCDGLYPDYEITVYGGDGETVAARGVSDASGAYRLSLRPGRYVIYTQNGPFEKNVKTNHITAVSGETTKLDLVIDTGIR